MAGISSDQKISYILFFIHRDKHFNLFSIIYHFFMLIIPNSLHSSRNFLSFFPQLPACCPGAETVSESARLTYVSGEPGIPESMSPWTVCRSTLLRISVSSGLT